MKPALLRALLAASLLINIGVAGALAYRALASERFPGLPRYLQWSEEQVQRWHAIATRHQARFYEGGVRG